MLYMIEASTTRWFNQGRNFETLMVPGFILDSKQHGIKSIQDAKLVAQTMLSDVIAHSNGEAGVNILSARPMMAHTDFAITP